MISPQELLEASTQKLKDPKNSVKLCPFKRINTKQGYSFLTLLRRKAKNIQAAIQLDVNWDRDEDLGFVKDVNARVNTQEKIIGDYCILYQDVIIFLSAFSSYTESMGQYEYEGKAVAVDKLPLIDKLSADETFGYSCVDLLCQIDNYNVIPEFLALGLDLTTEGVFLAKVEDSESVSMLRKSTDRIEQIRTDILEIRCINVTRQNVMHFICDLLDFGKENNLFGLVSDYQIKEINNYDNYSNLRGIRYSIELSLCYNISSIIKYIEKNISVIMFKIKEI